MTFWRQELKDANREEPEKKQVAWWGRSKQNPLLSLFPYLDNAILPPDIYEKLLDKLRNKPPFTLPSRRTNILAKRIAFQGDIRKARTLANLGAAKDPSTLVLISHFGHLARFITNGGSNLDGSYLNTFEVDGHPEKGFEWALDFFLRDMPLNSQAKHWQLVVLYYIQLEMCSPRLYPLRRLCDVLLLPASQGITIAKSVFHLILNRIALTLQGERKGVIEPPNFAAYSEMQLKSMIQVLRAMEWFGHDFRKDHEVHMAIWKATELPYQTLSELVRDLDKPFDTIHRPLLPAHFKLLERYHQKFEITPEAFFLMISKAAALPLWKSFLTRWRIPKMRGFKRDSDMWTLFWACLARGRDEATIVSALTRDYEDMLDEGEFLRLPKEGLLALLKCLDIVDPQGLTFEKSRWHVMQQLENKK